MSCRLTRITLATALATLGIAGSASAAPQLLIREIHETGTDGDYVVLQAYSAGQTSLAGTQVVTYDGGGGPFSHVVLSNVPNGANQATVLVGDAGVPGADATDATFNIINTGGTVCYAEGTSTVPPPTGIDCVAYRGSNAATVFAPAPPASPYGTPFDLGGQDLTGKSLIRSISKGCATALDTADDTNDSTADFSVGAPIMRNNAATPTEVPCPSPAGQIPPGGVSTCAGKPLTITGTNGPDKLSGTPGVDVIAGQGGKDKIKGLAGNDVICGGAGKDTLVGGKGNDLLRGEAGKDTLKGGAGKDKLKGGPGKDVQIQ